MGVNMTLRHIQSTTTIFSMPILVAGIGTELYAREGGVRAVVQMEPTFLELVCIDEWEPWQ
jgi:hypothetical protein